MLIIADVDLPLVFISFTMLLLITFASFAVREMRGINLFSNIFFFAHRGGVESGLFWLDIQVAVAVVDYWRYF